MYSTPCHRLLLLLCLALLHAACSCPDESSRTLAEQLDEIATLEQLRQMPDAKLARLLSDSSAEVRARAALCALRVGRVSEAVQAGLERLLRDSDHTVRARAVAALTATTAAASATDPKRRPQVLLQLHRRLGTETDIAVRRLLLRGLGQLEPTDSARLPERLLRALQRPAQLVAALLALSQWGERGGRLTAAQRQQLLSQLDNTPTAERAPLAMALAQTGGVSEPEQLQPLMPLIRGADAAPRLQVWALRAVRACPDASVLDAVAGRLPAPSYQVRVAAVRALLRCGDAGRARLLQGLRPLWRSVASNHYRLTGVQLHPILVALRELAPHAKQEPVRQLAQELWELTDVRDSAVSYGAKEAHAVDLVHCAAARLVDLGQGRLQHSRSCGSAGSKRLSRPLRLAVALDVLSRLPEPSTEDWRWLEQLCRDKQPAVRARAVAAVATAAPPDEPHRRQLLRRGIADAQPQVVAAAARGLAALPALADKQLQTVLFGQLAALSPTRHPAAMCQLLRATAVHGPAGGVAGLRATVERGLPRGVLRCVPAAIARSARGVRLPVEPAGSYQGPLPRRAKLVTSRGTVMLTLAQDAPRSVRRLLRPELYRAARVERVDPGRAVQIRLDAAQPVLPVLPDEPSAGQPLDAGAVVLTLPAGADTAQGALTLLLERQPWRNGRFTVVARIAEDQLEAVHPLQPGDEIVGLYPVASPSPPVDPANTGGR